MLAWNCIAVRAKARAEKKIQVKFCKHFSSCLFFHQPSFCCCTNSILFCDLLQRFFCTGDKIVRWPISFLLLILLVLGHFHFFTSLWKKSEHFHSSWFILRSWKSLLAHGWMAYLFKKLNASSTHDKLLRDILNWIDWLSTFPRKKLRL